MIRPLTVAGAAQVRLALYEFAPLLPVELLHVTTQRAPTYKFYNRSIGLTLQLRTMSKTPQLDQIDQIAERVDRLLLRYEELLRTNALLSAEVDTLVHERDSLKSRLSAARLRVETLLERLPEFTAAQSPKD